MASSPFGPLHIYPVCLCVCVFLFLCVLLPVCLCVWICGICVYMCLIQLFWLGLCLFLPFSLSLSLPCLLPSPPPSLSLAHSVPATKSSSLFLQHSRPSHAPEPLHWLSTRLSHGASLTSFRSSCYLLPDPSHLGHSY